MSLPYEEPLAGLTQQLRELRDLSGDDPELAPNLRALMAEVEKVARELLHDLSPWEKVLLSRHPKRPHFPDYADLLFDDFIELHGDRLYGDDAAIVGALARFPKGPNGRSVVIVGQQKGRGTKEAMRRNFGMPHPEGYRKALRMFDLAARFGRPVLTFIDTMGAFPGIGAEERGQAEAIGQCMLAMSQLPVPVIASILGEGGSGGALAIGVANRVLALEHIWYSVISPEACASILWKDAAQGSRAAIMLKPTAAQAKLLGVVDTVVSEPPGGAHLDSEDAAHRLGATLLTELEALERLSPAELIEDRYRRFRALGTFSQGSQG